VKRTCNDCKVEKPIEGFFRKKSVPSGYASICKECDKARHRAWAKTPRGRLKELVREKAKIEKNREHYRAKSRDRFRRRYSQWGHAKPDPLKQAARSAVARAVRTGDLARPKSCVDCKAIVGLHAHHEDYSKPLDVVWVCSVCHGRRHRSPALVAAMLGGRVRPADSTEGGGE
jgi:hypothetical protein